MWYRKLALPFLLFASTVAAYLPTLGNGFTNWDDPRYVTGNPFAARGLAGIPAAFTTSWDGVWYPLTHAVICVIQTVAGPAPFAHHLVQILLAALAVACLPGALATFGMRRTHGAAAALLWALHPMRVEPFAWASSLKDVLALLGTVLALAAWGRGRKRIAAACFVAALLAKSTVFPLAMLFVWFEAARPSDLPRAIRRTVAFWGPAIACALVSMRSHLEPPPEGRVLPGGSLLERVPTAIYLPWWYVGRALSVAHPQAVYEVAAVGWLDVRLLMAVALWCVALLCAWRLPLGDARTRWGALLAFALPFAPVTGLVPLAFPVADRFASLPSIALAAVLVAMGAACCARLRAATRVAAGAGAGAVAAAFCLPVTVGRQQAWRDGIALWEADRLRAPGVGAVRINLAAAYGEAGRWSDAIGELQAMHRLGISYEHRARDLFFALAARDGMEPGLVRRLSALIAADGGSRESVRFAQEISRRAGHPAVADQLEALLLRGAALSASGVPTTDRRVPSETP